MDGFSGKERQGRFRISAAKIGAFADRPVNMAFLTRDNEPRCNSMIEQTLAGTVMFAVE
jgi:hypothetical protein